MVPSLSRPFVSTHKGQPWTTAEIGIIGESTAALWLEQQQRKVLSRNFRARYGGEVDIVCREPDRPVLVFVEVKTRTRMDPRHRPAQAVNKHKQELIKEGAHLWISQLRTRRRVSWRYDIIEVHLIQGEPPHIHCIVNAFQE